MKNNNITTIAFDADDTLWINEPYFREVEDHFCALLEDYMPAHAVNKELFKKEIENLSLYGYGIKALMLSMVETALEITDQKCDPILIRKAIEYGKEMLQKPVVLLDDVQPVLERLQNQYRLVVATKGDLLDQERKLKKSGLEKYFHHIEIMSNKHKEDFQKLLKHLDCIPDHFMMIGNSLKSDIIPVLELGGHAVHIPYHITWQHEHIETNIDHPNFNQLDKISHVLELFEN